MLLIALKKEITQVYPVKLISYLIKKYNLKINSKI